MKNKRLIETCFSPKLFSLFDKQDRLIVVTDIFRATSSICAALGNGAREIVAVSEKQECLEYKKKGFIIAGERDGKLLDYADMGNSPDGFLTPEIKGRSIVLNTTNGTRTIRIAGKHNNPLVIGAFINLKALTDHIIKENKHILIFCSGWKDHFSLEDSLFAGALATEVLSIPETNFHTKCDATHAAIDIWKTAKHDARKYVEKAAHRHRLKHMKLDNVIDYCMQTSIVNVVPVLKNNRLVNFDDI